MQPRFELDRYLARVGLRARPALDLDGLVAVQAAQLRAIPFENLDVVLGIGIGVEPSMVYDKLVVRRRGGYCFECNGLLRDALVAMGFDARLLLGRVVIDRNDGLVPARTHAVVAVRLGEATYVVDCGFGAQTPRAPLRLEDGAAAGHEPVGRGGWQLASDQQFGWRVLRIEPGSPPRDLYVFDLSRVYQADVELGNHWTSTHPSTHFTQRLIAVRHTDRGRIVLDGRRLVEHTGEGTEEQTLESAAALIDAVSNRIAIAIAPDAEQQARLWTISGSTPG